VGRSVPLRGTSALATTLKIFTNQTSAKSKNGDQKRTNYRRISSPDLCAFWSPLTPGKRAPDFHLSKPQADYIYLKAIWKQNRFTT